MRSSRVHLVAGVVLAVCLCVLAAALPALGRGSAVSGAQAAAPGNSGPPMDLTQGFTVRLDLPKPAPVGGVKLHLVLRNVTSEPLSLSDAYPEADYRLTVTDASGRLVPSSGPPLDVWRNVELEIQPREALTQDYDLTKVYGPLADGEYTIVARRFALRVDGDGMGEVKSNPITIVVSGGQARQIAPQPSMAAARRQPLRRLSLLAVRPILERHGFGVIWDPVKRTMTASRGKLVASFGADRDAIVVNGHESHMSRPAKIIRGQLSAPGQAVSAITNLGADQVGELCIPAARIALIGTSGVPGAQAAAPSDNWGPITQGFRVQLALAEPASSPEASAPTGAAEGSVMLRFTLQNVTADPLVVMESNPGFEYRLTVTDAFGDALPCTAGAFAAQRRTTRVVAPGETIVSDYNLTAMYGQLPDGEYGIAARRIEVFRLDGEGVDEVASNLIAIAVSRGRPTQIASGGGGAPGTTKGTALQLARTPGLLAVRPVLERHGFRVHWDAAKQTLTASKGKLVATIRAQKSVMMLGRQETRTAKPAQLVRGQLSAPGQAISMITSLASGPAAG